MGKEVALNAATLAHTFEEVLEQIPEKPLGIFVEQEKLSGGGMRPGNTAFMRKLVVNRYASQLQKPQKSLASFLRQYMPEARLLTMLAIEELENRRGQLMVFFGKARLILALLQDRREDVREMAQRWMAESGGDLPDEESAQKAIRSAFAPVAAVGQGASSPEGNKRLREALSVAEQENEKLKKDAKRERRAIEEEIHRLEREQRDALATKDFAIGEAKRKVEQLEAALQRETSLRTLRVEELLAKQKIELFRGWLKPVCAVEEVLDAGKTKPLLERAQEVLAAQRKADRAAARQHEAEAELSAIEEILTEIEQTLAVAQTILPETRSLREALRTQQEVLKGVLGQSFSEYSALAQELAKRIDACTEQDYGPIYDWLRLSEQLKAISPSESKALRLRFHRQLTRWAAANPTFTPEDIGLDEDADSAAILKRNPLLADALAGRGEMILFLDGHNILNGLGRYRQRRGQPQTHSDARERLERDMARLFGLLPLVSVNLVWDGMEKTHHNVGDNILVHFSGGTGEHRADRYIISQMDYYKTQTDVPVVLVTDDNGFAGEARKRGAQVCRLHDFEAFLDVPRT